MVDKKNHQNTLFIYFERKSTNFGFFHFYSFNAVHIPKTDETLNATSRRYGTRTEPQTHPNNHSHYKPNETTFRASFINPKRHPSSVYRSRDPDQEFSNERTVKIHEHVQDKSNINGQK